MSRSEVERITVKIALICDSFDKTAKLKLLNMRGELLRLWADLQKQPNIETENKLYCAIKDVALLLRPQP